MRPTKPGYYWYRDEPVHVWWWSAASRLAFEAFGPGRIKFVATTKPDDWGEEIVNKD